MLFEVLLLVFLLLLVLFLLVREVEWKAEEAVLVDDDVQNVIFECVHVRQEHLTEKFLRKAEV